jgi:hypothetical protein
MRRALLAIALFATTTTAQELLDYSLGGYAQFMHSTWAPERQEEWTTWSELKNRLDFAWYPTDALALRVGSRNRFEWGGLIQATPNYVALATRDDGYVDLDYEFSSDRNHAFYGNVDRFHVEYWTGDLVATLGRQRVNWSFNLTWTPNDIFNSYSIFDFDYVERPGCDAASVVYYTGVASSFHAAAKIDGDEKTTVAAMYRWNAFEYDFQVLGGTMRDDYVAGGAWSGVIGEAGFNGEATYFGPKDDFLEGAVVFSAGANYAFENALSIRGAYLFNSGGSTRNASHGSFMEMGNVSAKTPTLARHSVYAEAALRPHPLVRVVASGVFNPNDGSRYFSPTVEYLPTEDLDVALLAQIFHGDARTEFGDYGTLAFARFRYHF